MNIDRVMVSWVFQKPRVIAVQAVHGAGLVVSGAGTATQGDSQFREGAQDFGLQPASEAVVGFGPFGRRAI